MRVEKRIPEWASVCLVVEESPGEDIVMDAGGGVHGVSALGGVDDGLERIAHEFRRYLMIS